MLTHIRPGIILLFSHSHVIPSPQMNKPIKKSYSRSAATTANRKFYRMATVFFILSFIFAMHSTNYSDFMAQCTQRNSAKYCEEIYRN